MIFSFTLKLCEFNKFTIHDFQSFIDERKKERKEKKIKRESVSLSDTWKESKRKKCGVEENQR